MHLLTTEQFFGKTQYRTADKFSIAVGGRKSLEVVNI